MVAAAGPARQAIDICVQTNKGTLGTCTVAAGVLTDAAAGAEVTSVTWDSPAITVNSASTFGNGTQSFTYILKATANAAGNITSWDENPTGSVGTCVAAGIC